MKKNMRRMPIATPGQNRRSFPAALFLNARELAKGSG
jgi:hypothetical protein